VYEYDGRYPRVERLVIENYNPEISLSVLLSSNHNVRDWYVRLHAHPVLLQDQNGWSHKFWRSPR
jgi:hypothetical protein